MNPFLGTPQERLADWKAFRNQLKTRSEDDQLVAVARYFAQAPLLKAAYQPYAPETWPSAWEMIHNGYWCAWSTAIGMDMTLRLAGWDRQRLKLLVIQAEPLAPEKFVLQVDEKTLLNYDHGVVVPGLASGPNALVTVQFNGKIYVRNDT